MAWRFMPEDFKMRSTYGTVEGSSLEDWPISYNDLEPFYEKVEWEIGVAGRAGETPFEEPRNKPYPMPPLPHNKGGQLIAEAGARLGLHRGGTQRGALLRGGLCLGPVDRAGQPVRG